MQRRYIDSDGEVTVERVRHLLDLEALRDITARYALATNKAVAPVDVDALPEIFAANATWEGRGQRVEGLDAIMEGLRASTKALEFSLHAFVNPVLELDGDVASGRWIVQLVGNLAGSYHVGFSTEDFTYTRTPEGWRIQSVTLHPGTLFPLPPSVTPPTMSLPDTDRAVQDEAR